MAPFLHGRKAFNELRSSIRALLTPSKKSDAHKVGKFENIDEHHKMFDLERSGRNRAKAFATAERQYIDGLDDTIPLHPIDVTDRVDVC